MAPKAYRLLRTILTTAVDDELIARNPCRIRSAGVDRSTAQQVVSIPQLYAIADAIADRYRALVLLTGLAGLRAGELFVLTRGDIDLERGTVDVNKQRVRLDSGEVLVTSPKSDAGRRTVALPHVLTTELEAHLASFVGPSTTDLVFTGSLGAPLDRTNFQDRFWKPATAAAGVPSLRLHDLRHTAATLAATTGASTKELMARLGHASPRAALIYQHATRDRDVAIADALSDLVERARQTDRDT
jgi:integrase